MKKFYITLLLFIACTVFSNADDFIEIYSVKNQDSSFSIFADNMAYCPVYINITFSILNNLSANENIPYEVVLPARSSRNDILLLSPINIRERTSFRYSYKYHFGDPFNTIPNSNYQYLFPFARSMKFKVTQTFNGTFSHFGEIQYAVDFAMPEGTGVYAARSGIVVEVKEDSNIGGNNCEYWNSANYILVYHSDGTFGNYLHLSIMAQMSF
jgi:murein DD-endopeptidase MepM/ murein hydrolase activator NlpD